MAAAGRQKLVSRLAAVSGAIGLVCVLILTGDYLLSVIRAGEDNRRVDALVEQIKTDATIAGKKVK